MFDINSNELQYRMIKTLKTPIIYAILLNIIIRIPYFTHAQGSDAFVVAWMGQAIREGFFDAWTIHPLSIFALYPFSFYPIGGPLIISVLFWLGFNVDSAFFIFSFLFMFISIITTYYLGKLIFLNDKICTFFFVVFYTTSPIFLGYTYWTATVRGPFMAILPLTMYFLLKITKELNIKNISGLLLSTFLLALMHRLVILFPIFLLALGCAIILIKFNFLQRKFLPIYLISYLCALILGILIFPIDQNVTTEFILSNNSLIGLIWNLTIDYTLKFGIILLLTILGFFDQFSFCESSETELKFHMFFLVFGFFCVFILPISTYSTSIILPWCGYFAIIGLKFLQKQELNKIKILLGIIPVLFGLLYSYFVVFLPMHLIGATILVLVSVLEIRIKQKKKSIYHFYIILCFSIVILSKISTDGLIVESNFPFKYVSDDEIIIAQYLRSYNSEQEITIVYDIDVARRIQAMSFQPVIYSMNFPANIYYDWISPEEIRKCSVVDFSVVYHLGYGHPFRCSCPIPEKTFYLSSYRDLRIEYYVKEIRSAGIRYIVVNNPLSVEPERKFPLFTSIREVGILRIETHYLQLFEVPEILN